MRELRKRLCLSICMIWFILFVFLIGSSTLVLHLIALHYQENLWTSYLQMLVFYWVIMIFVLFLCCLVSYALAKAYLEDKVVFQENRFRFRGYFYFFDEIKSITYKRFLFVWKIKIRIINQKTAIVYKNRKEDILNLLQDYNLEKYLKK